MTGRGSFIAAAIWYGLLEVCAAELFRIEDDPIWTIAWILVLLLVSMPFGVNAYSAITYRKV